MNLSISIAPLYIALAGLIFLPMTLRVGLFRVKQGIDIGDGNDDEMLRRIRGQANFIETVPIALMLLLAMELLGASPGWLHGVGATLLAGRILHYLGLTKLGPFVCRPIGMVATLGSIATASLWLLLALF
ncbi:MAG: MAPEG family protein [Pseudomonadota bacterium]